MNKLNRPIQSYQLNIKGRRGSIVVSDGISGRELIEGRDYSVTDTSISLRNHLSSVLVSFDNTATTKVPFSKISEVKRHRHPHRFKGR